MCEQTQKQLCVIVYAGISSDGVLGLCVWSELKLKSCYFQLDTEYHLKLLKCLCSCPTNPANKMSVIKPLDLPVLPVSLCGVYSIILLVCTYRQGHCPKVCLQV